MIAYLKGTIQIVKDNYIVLNIGGVGYKIEVGFSDMLTNQEVELFIHTHVRENEFRLFGFKTERELEIFQKLLEVSGVGPKVSMALISNLGVDRILNAVEIQNPAGLKAPGVGTKTAEKIILELKNKLEKIHGGGQTGVRVSEQITQDAIEALVTLGYKRFEVEREFYRLHPGADWGSEDIIKELLKKLSVA
jgi:Holliday junction DNA helicase RuvA